jgi:N-acetylmuramoyl-L-alanine amidase
MSNLWSDKAHSPFLVAYRLAGATATLIATVLLHWVTAAQATPVCEPANFRIAIDVGHTPQAPGTTSARGVTEYAFNLELAKRIKKTLLDGGFVGITLITERGTGRPQLLRRPRRANTDEVDLFLSIHHDDVQDSYHETWLYNGQTRIFSDKFSGYSLFVSRENQHFEESLTFAKLLGAALMARGMRYSAHHAEPIEGEGRQLVDSDVGVYLYDQLVVLKFTKAPAVLLEAGVIVNRAEELQLASPKGHEQVSAAVLEAVRQFCAEQQVIQQSR